MVTIDGGGAADPVEKKKCFVVSPIGKADSDERRQADSVLKHIIKNALANDYDVLRADDESNPGSITPTIINSIINADLIVADISGGNANVFYELALAHGYDRPTVHIQAVGDRVPFDIKDMRIINYDLKDLDSVDSARERIRMAADFAVKSPAEIDTPLKGAQNFQNVATSDDPSAQLTARILEEILWMRDHLTTPQNIEDPFADESSTYAADAAGYQRIISRAGAAARLEESDFKAVVTTATSLAFDEWVRSALGRVVRSDSRGRLNNVLHDAQMKKNAAANEEALRRQAQEGDEEAPF